MTDDQRALRNLYPSDSKWDGNMQAVPRGWDTGQVESSDFYAPADRHLADDNYQGGVALGELAGRAAFIIGYDGVHYGGGIGAMTPAREGFGDGWTAGYHLQRNGR